MEETILRRTWAEIDLDALEHNYREARRRTGVKYLGVVKADAYGHGAVQIGRKLEQLGADASQCLFLDDAQANVDAAQALGYKVYKTPVRYDFRKDVMQILEEEKQL